MFLNNPALTEWQQIGEALPGKKVNALPIANPEIYAGVYREGIFVSKDDGKNGQSISYDLPELRLQAIFKHGAHILGGTDIGIFRLDASQQQWLPVFRGPQILSFQAEGEKLIAGTSQGVLLSADRGANWTWIHQEGAIHHTALLAGKIFAMICRRKPVGFGGLGNELDGRFLWSQERFLCL